MKKINNNVYSIELPNFQATNTAIFEKFMQYRQHEDTKKNHYFEGRYENIYISPVLIPELQTILDFSQYCVEKIIDKTNLKSGLWFNEMATGQQTLSHTHDDDNELYSAVYYVKIPPNSGNLILEISKQKFTVVPREGKMVLFPPTMPHYVTVNNSKNVRISLGINIGSIT